MANVLAKVILVSVPIAPITARLRLVKCIRMVNVVARVIPVSVITALSTVRL
jgi:hypothetical protein